jgi:hypothetical protein
MNRLFFSLFLAALCTASSALAKERVAVLKPLLAPGVTMSPGVLEQLAEEARGVALETLPKDKYLVMTRENTVIILKDMGIDCTKVQGECAVETAKNMGAAYVITGNVLKVGETWIFNIRMHQTETSSLVSHQKIEGETEIALIGATKGATRVLLKKALPKLSGRQGTTLRVTGGATTLRDLDLGDDITNKTTDQTAYIAVESTPPGATVLVNGKERGVTPYQGEHPWGRYKVTLSLGQYHPAQKEVTLASNQTQELNFKLNPAFGSMKITSEPSGARVFLDGEEAGRTPLDLKRKPSRGYLVRLEAPNFNPHEQELVVEDEKTASMHAKLSSSVGGVQIDSRPSGAQVTLNGEVVGKTPYSVAKKPPGTYQVRISKPLYLSSDFSFKLVEGEQYRETVNLEPNFGSLTVRSEPAGARIIRSGKDTGKKTPHRFDMLQAGNVTIALELAGYGTWRGSPRIEVGKDAVVAEKLVAMLGTLNIKTFLPDGNPCRGEVRVDDEAIGSSPLIHQVVATVPHVVTASCKGMNATRRLTVAHNKRIEVQLKVQTFSMTDLRQARSGLKSAKTLDTLGFVGTGGLLTGSIISLSSSSSAYQQADDITGTSNSSNYESLRSQGASLQTTGLVLGGAAVGILSATLWHKLVKTKARRAKVVYIEGQMKP